LLIVPAPAKPMIHPDKFHGGQAPLYNRSWPQLRSELEQAGVLVFDPAPLIVSNHLSYLKTDTHWRPETMETVAQALAQFIRNRVPNLPAVEPPPYQDRELTVTNTGDTAAMLQVSYPPETVTIRQVRLNGRRWEADDTAAVLLLGDSFANIYSAAEMKWGAAAGLAERLSVHLRRPLDSMTRNDDGAHATRLLYAMAQAQTPDRVAPKKLVIWEFAARELAVGDWKRLP
jgi:alginate O-acetyltransferase complex protein AlgJ